MGVQEYFNHETSECVAVDERRVGYERSMYTF